MSESCSHIHCYAPDFPCNMGESDFHKCKFWKGVSAKKDTSRAGDSGGLLPWSSGVLGTVDLEYIAARSRTTILGVLGPYNAGKTTWLAGLYLLLSRGFTIKDRLFAGSYTFGGWENLAHWLRWPQGGGPNFPPHTPNSSERRPGLLHLSFRREDGQLEDVILTDAPGEWFERWALDKDDPNAEGTRWITRNADGFALFIDSEALVGQKRGQARNLINSIAQRLSDERLNRPVAVVWAKSDIEIGANIQTSLANSFDKYFRDRKDYKITFKDAAGNLQADYAAFTDVLSGLLLERNRKTLERVDLPVYNHDDLFLAFRGN